MCQFIMGAEAVVLITRSWKHYVCDAFWGVLYQVGRRHPRSVLVPCNLEYDPACGARPSSDDLDFDKWFCQTPIITELSCFPGTTCWLQNSYDIVFVPQPRRCERIRPACSRWNTVLRRLFDVPWRGSLIVVKRGYRDPHSVVHITRREIALINTLVERGVPCQVIAAHVILNYSYRWLRMQLEELEE